MDANNKETNFPVLTPTHRILAISETFLCSVAFILNTYLLFLLVWKIRKTLKHSNAVFLLNLAVWDFIFSALLTSMSVKKLINEHIYLSLFECGFEGFFSNALGFCSFISIALLALDRYLKVVLRMNLKLYMCIVMILVSVCIAFGAATMPFILLQQDGFVLQPSGFYCFVNVSLPGATGIITTVVVFVYYISCFLIISVCYVSIIRRIYEVQGSLMKFPKVSMGPKDEECSGTSSTAERSSTRISISVNVLQTPSSVSPKDRLKVPVNQVQDQAAVAARRNRNIDVQLAVKTILIGSTHMVLYVMFGVCAFCQAAGVKGIEYLDIVAVHLIFLCLILDPIWSLLFDQRIREFMLELQLVCKQSIKSNTFLSTFIVFREESNAKI